MRRLAAFALSFSYAVLALCYALPGLLPLGLLPLLKREDRRRRAALVLCGLAAGALWFYGYDGLFCAPARGLEGQTVSLTATVEDWPEAVTSGARLTVRAEGLTALPFRMQLYTGKEGLSCAPGDRVTAAVRCLSADESRGEAVYYRQAEGVRLVAYARGNVLRTPAVKIPPFCWPAWMARWLRVRLEAALPAGDAPLAVAVVTGQRGALPEGMQNDLRRAGLSHAVAVSGMHVAFLAGALYLLLGKGRRRAAAVTLPLVWLFALAAGCTPSVIRAAVMETLVLLAPLLGRETDPVTSLSFALLLLLAQNPRAAAGVSLQLSFAAVAGILLFSGRIFDRMRALLPPKRGGGWYGRIRGWVLRLVCAPLAAALGAVAFTTPLAAWYFDSISLAAPLSGLLALPAVGLLFALGLAAALAGAVCPPAGALLAGAAVPAARYLEAVIPRLARLPFAALTPRGYYGAWLLLVYGLALLFLAAGRPRRPVVPACCAVAALCAALLLTRLTDTISPATAEMLDVGQGQCVLLRMGDRTAVVDCGGSSLESAGDRAADWMADRGIRTVDLLVLTHFHADHAGGVPELFRRMPVSVLAVPKGDDDTPLRAEILSLAAEHGTQVVTVQDDRTLLFGSGRLRLYAPLGGGETNEEGLSVLCTVGRWDMLLTGDMDEITERRLVQYGDLPDLEVLVAGHHGAASSTSDQLLAATRPEQVLISVGYNTYGHPSDEMMRRAAAWGAALYRTDRMGDITVTVEGG